jgi:hypothetical protein
MARGVEEITGKFTIEQIQNKSNDNFRTVAKDENDKQVGSTFDEDISDTLMAYPEGAEITLEIDKSGQFWDIVGARLADKGDNSKVRARKSTPPAEKPAFSKGDMTYFIGSASRVVAAYLQSSKEYVDTIENTKDPIKALHEDVVLGAKLMFNKASE